MRSVFDAVPISAPRCGLAESPLWQQAVGLRWVDITNRKLLTAEADGRVSVVRLSTRVTAVELAFGERLFAVTTNGFGWLDPLTGNVEQWLVSPLEAGEETLNDCGIDELGRCWVGSAHGGPDGGTLFRLEGRKLSPIRRKLLMSNGIDWSPDRCTMYHVDSGKGTIGAFNYDLAAGEISAPRVFRTVPASVGLPDGLTVDSEGFVWVAIWGAGEVWRLDPADGRVDAIARVKTPLATSCVFGGDDMRTLYITTARDEDDPGSGLVYEASVGVRGRPGNRFGGA